MKRGLFVSLEGLEATGKTTIANMLKEEFSNVVVTREPGGIPSAEKMRKVIMENDILAETELLLFLAARREHLHKKIIPVINSGKTIICDRYAHSSIAYQGAGREIGMEKVKELNDFATTEIYPDITFFIDIPVEISLERKRSVSEQNRLDKESVEFYKRVRLGYLEMAESKGKYGNIYIIDGQRSVDEIAEEILLVINSKKEERNDMDGK